MCSLKLYLVTAYFVFYGRALVLDTPPFDLENTDEHTPPAGRTSVQRKEIHNLFSNETQGHTSANGTTDINDKVSLSNNDSVSKTLKMSQDFNTTKEVVTLVTPTVSVPDSVAGVGTSSNKLSTFPVSNQVSTERVTYNSEFPLEGGGTVTNMHPSSSEPAADKVNVTDLQDDSLSLQSIYSDTELSNKTSTVVGRKGAEYKPSKIVARKGVESCSCCPNVTSLENCTMCCGSPNELHSDEEVYVKNNLSTQEVENTNVTSSNNTLVGEQRTNKSTVLSPIEAKKTKATKPLYTLDAVNDNVGNVSVVQAPTKMPEQGSNYVVPVVGTILMVPLIAVLSVFIYKKGCEFWERRHYRRMDFLIDGMYND